MKIIENNKISISNVGIFGCGKMGSNLALNISSNSFIVSVYDCNKEAVNMTVSHSKDECKNIINGFYNVESFVNSLIRPRCIIILVIAGKLVDDILCCLKQYLDENDIIIDGGNEWWKNSVRREQKLKDINVHYMDMGISGGEQGARNGASIMLGGNINAYKIVEPILIKMTAKSKLGSCVKHLGPIGSGNYVKMVHNGIEYANMQLIAEIYDILKIIGKFTNEELAKIFEEWNNTDELNSYLIQITSIIFNTPDNLFPSRKLIDYILDKADMKGTGCWTIQEAAERSCPVPTLAAALDARYFAANKDERIIGKVLKGPNYIKVNNSDLLNLAKNALYFCTICVYSQGFALIKKASEEFSWQISLAECARIWTGGCIIRSSLLFKIYDAFQKNPDLPNLMLDEVFITELNNNNNYLRELILIYIINGVPCSALSASLNYYDTYRQEYLPANLIQAQRDFFGGHTYKRIDIPGNFHTKWSNI